MLSLIDVKCPHCHAEGRIVTPPPGSIIVGPCPECSEMVAVFGGKVLALDKDLMLHGSLEDRKRHLLEVLGVFLEGRVDRLLSQAEAEAEADGEQPELDAESEGAALALPSEPRVQLISDNELKHFVTDEMNQLDNSEAFRAIFG